MKLRRTVLLFCSNEEQRSAFSFVLAHHGYRVIGGISGEPPIPDAVLIVDDRSLGTVTVAKRIAELIPTAPMFILLAPQYSVAHGYPCWARVLKSDAKPAQILHALYLATNRKRGPRGPRAEKMVVA